MVLFVTHTHTGGIGGLKDDSSLLCPGMNKEMNVKQRATVKASAAATATTLRPVREESAD